MASCSIIISWFRLGFRGLSPYFFGILFHHHFLVPTRVPGLCRLTLLASCSIIFSWFWLRFRGLSPYSVGILFHHHFLVPARVPGLVLLLFWHSVLPSVPCSGRDPGLLAQTALELNGARNSSKKKFCSTMIFWCQVFWRSVASSFPQSFWFRVEFRGLFPWHPVPSSFPGSGLVPSGPRNGRGACLRITAALCSIMISSFLLVPARVRGLFPSFSFFSFLRKRIVFHRDFLAPSGSGLGFRGLSPFFSFGAQ